MSEIRICSLFEYGLIRVVILCAAMSKTGKSSTGNVYQICTNVYVINRRKCKLPSPHHHHAIITSLLMIFFKDIQRWAFFTIEIAKRE